jgi:hypothetical protein
MDIKLDINPESIQEEVVRAILASSLGNNIKTVIDEQIKELSNTYNKALKIEVQHAITNHITAILRSEEYSNKLKDAVSAKLASSITDEFLDTVVKTAFEKIEKNYSSSYY